MSLRTSTAPWSGGSRSASVPRPVQKRVEVHISSGTGGKAVAVGVPQSVHAGVAVLVANLAVLISGASVKAKVMRFVSHFKLLQPAMIENPAAFGGIHNWRFAK
jgi:hypothetical protein